MNSPVANTPLLVRLALRRDRWLLTAWVVGLASMAVFSAAATRSLYPTQASRRLAAEAINATAALVALYGRIYDPTSRGAISLIKQTAFGASMVAVLMVFVVIRHTRSDEESGRLELVSAGVVGRAAPLLAALIVAFGASVAVGLLSMLGLMAVGLPRAGCVSFGAGWMLTGIAFSSIAGVTAQLTQSSRAARGLALMSVGVAYVLRAIGDLAAHGPGWASWLSPIGWSQQLRPFAGDRLWVSVLPIGFTAAIAPVAFILRSRRDLGSGLLPDRPGRSQGSLAGVVALAWRLQRGVFAAWLAGSALLAFVLGSTAHNVVGLLNSPQIRRYIAVLGGERGLMDAFLTAEILLLGGIHAAYGVAATARLRSDETSGYTELVLSTPTTRTRWAASHYGVGLAGLVVILLVNGAAVGLGHSLSLGSFSRFGHVFVAGAAQIPAGCVMASLVLALFGWAARATGAAWGLFVFFIVLGEFGAMWQLPSWVLELSPFAHSPRLPAGPWSVKSVVGLLAAAAALAAGGFVGWRRRDLVA